MVLERRPACKPLYATRLAPFAVYDCLKPARDGVIETQNGRAALYLCLYPRSGLAAVHIRRCFGWEAIAAGWIYGYMT